MKVEKEVFLIDGGKSANCTDDDETTVSGRPFQTWAAATGKARLPTVNSLMGGATRRVGQRRRQDVPDIAARAREAR